MKFLVTGGAGFIGATLSSYLASHRHDVTAIDNFNSYYSPELKKARTNRLFEGKNIKLIEVDLCDYIKISEIVSKEKPDFVIHLAAQAGVRLKYKDYHLYTQSNLNGFANILNATLQNDIPNFIYASSSSVYGSNSTTPYRENQNNLKPISFYGNTKLCNELLANSASKNSNTKTRGLRLFTVYGPWGRPDMAYFRLVASGMNSHKFNLFGDGSVLRDFTYIEDVTRIVLKLSLELDLRPMGFSDVVNIGGGSSISMKEAIATVEKYSPKDLEISYLEKNTNDVAVTEASSEYLFKLINDIPETKFVDGIKETIKWAEQPENAIQLGKWIESC
jgi:UDP-glucuronate 4-epimerase